jgi:uncharacterized membrane protein (DUF2068 family)
MGYIHPVRRERGLVAIIAYKLIKATVWLVFAVVLAANAGRGLGGQLLLSLAEHLRHHAHAWSLALAGWLMRASSPRGLWTIVVALLADGSFSLLEGWALFRGFWWAPWMVVVATASFMPFEVIAVAHYPHPVRIAVLALNLAIVVYLARRVGRGFSPDRSLGSP